MSFTDDQLIENEKQEAQLEQMLAAFCNTCVRSNVNDKTIQRAMRRCLIKSAVCEIEGVGGNPSFHQVAMRTGIDQRTVSKLSRKNSTRETFQLNPACFVLHHWQSDPAYQKTLPITGPAPSFQSLCSTYAHASRWSIILDWLKDCDCVEENAGNVTFAKASAIPENAERRTEQAKRALALFSSNVDQNLASSKEAKDRLFQKHYYSREIPDRLVDKLQQLLTSKLDAFYEEVAKEIDQFEVDHNTRESDPDKRNLVGIGLFLYHPKKK